MEYKGSMDETLGSHKVALFLSPFFLLSGSLNGRFLCLYRPGVSSDPFSLSHSVHPLSFRSTVISLVQHVVQILHQPFGPFDFVLL